jgi:hypothetical protein
MPTKGFTTSGGRRVSFYDPTLSTGYSANLWKSCPLLEYQFDPMIGFMIDERWHSYDAAATTGDYVLTQATTGTGAISTAAPGVLELDSNSTTTAQGATLQHNKAVFVPAAGKHIWAEFKIKIVDTFDKAEIFVGLSELDTTLIAAAANSSANHIGWQCVTDDGVLLFTGEKAGAGATRAAATIAEATYITLGFYVNGVTEIEQYINGVLTGTNTATANIPIVAIYPSFVCQSGGTNDPIMHIQGYRIFQLR